MGFVTTLTHPPLASQLSSFVSQMSEGLESFPPYSGELVQLPVCFRRRRGDPRILSIQTKTIRPSKYRRVSVIRIHT